MSASYFWIGSAVVAISAVGGLVGGILVKNNWGYWNRSQASRIDSKAVTAENPVTVNAPNSPGSTNLAIGHANNVTVHKNDPNGTGTINKKLDMLISTFEVTKEMQRLANEYDLGFVVIAFPIAVDATRVKPYSNKIQADWDSCEVYRDAEGSVFAKVPHFRIKGSPEDSVTAALLQMGIPTIPGIHSRTIIVGKVAMQSELLNQAPSGSCAVIGFKTVKAP